MKESDQAFAENIRKDLTYRLNQVRNELQDLHHQKEDIDGEIYDKTEEENEILQELKEWPKEEKEEEKKDLWESPFLCQCCSLFKDCKEELEIENPHCKKCKIVMLPKECNFLFQVDLNRYCRFDKTKNLRCLPGSCQIRNSQQYIQWKKI